MISTNSPGWNINEILPYQRNFNFITGERSIGKTYTTLKYILKKCIFNNLEFIYICRTQREKESGILENAQQKVLNNEFKKDVFRFTESNGFLVKDRKPRLLSHCLALSEASKIKKMSFPRVKYIIFDEYIIEKNSTAKYVNGYDEPDLFLSIYHTADRDEDRIICFLLGNMSTFYNPYHVHPAFNIPEIGKGQIWTSENVLYQNAVAKGTLKEQKEKSKFGRMIDDTKYGDFANKGINVDENNLLIEKMSGNPRYMFTIIYMSEYFGIFSDYKVGKVFISDKYDKTSNIVYALTLDDHSENTLLTKGSSSTMLSWLIKNYKLGNVRFTSPLIKSKAENFLKLLFK